MAIKEKDDPVFFRFITDGNLLRQYDFLKSCVDIALKDRAYVLSDDVIRQLNNHAVVSLCDSPGMYRTIQVNIANSPHVPPEWEKVNGLMDECLLYLTTGWEKHSAIHLAAYALWRLCWIHPFVEGNGRTARATSYLVLCVKHGMWLPGTNTIPKQIRHDRTPYYAALRDADDRYKHGGAIDISALETYMEQLLTKQLGG